MAKKKSTQRSKGSNKQNPSQQTPNPVKDSTFTKSSESLSRQSSMEDLTYEKLHNLKELNSFLVSETSKKRQQIESLIHDKEILEAELSGRKESERDLSEKNMIFEMQYGFFEAYLGTQMKEMDVEREREILGLKKKVNGLVDNLDNERQKLSSACQERDSARKNYQLQVNEAGLMKKKLMEMEKKESKFLEEIRKLKVEYEKVVGEKEELAGGKHSLEKERDFLEKKVKDLGKEAENLRRKIEEVVREKKETEMEKKEQGMKIMEMKNEMQNMSETILIMRKEEGVLLSKVSELEKNCGEAMDKEAQLAKEIRAMVEDVRAKEKSIDRLMEVKDSVSRTLERTMVESEDRQRRIENLTEERNSVRRELELNGKEIKEMTKQIEELLEDKMKIEKLVLGSEKENLELQSKVSELRNVVKGLEEACRDHEMKNQELICELSSFKNSFNQVSFERDSALKGLDEEKQNSASFRSKALEVEKILDKTAEDLAQNKAEWQKLIKEKEEIESQFKSMNEEKGRLHKDLQDANRSISDLRAKMESTRINYERALSLLKNTASLLCQSKDENERKVMEEAAAIAEQKLEEEIEPYSAQLEAIKQAFKSKETVAQDLKQKVEVLEKSMVEAHKKKSLWTLVSSATTLLAAISVAYAARGR